MRSFSACPETLKLCLDSLENGMSELSCKCWRQEGKIYSWTTRKQGLWELGTKVWNLFTLLKPTSLLTEVTLLTSNSVTCCGNLDPNETMNLKKSEVTLMGTLMVSPHPRRCFTSHSQSIFKMLGKKFDTVERSGVREEISQAWKDPPVQYRNILSEVNDVAPSFSH